jgi:hypothetical protein
VLHFEASDEFPKGADVNGHGIVESFIELGSVFPSCLPADERALLRDSLHRSLHQIGFRERVFHLEARVANSAADDPILLNVCRGFIASIRKVLTYQTLAPQG